MIRRVHERALSKICIGPPLSPPPLAEAVAEPPTFNQQQLSQELAHVCTGSLISLTLPSPRCPTVCVCVCVCRTRVAPRAARSSQRGKTRGEGKQIRLLPTLPTERAASSVFKVACTANSSYILGVYVSVAVERYEIERERKEKEAEQESGAGGSFKAERARRGRRAWIERGGRQTRSSLEESRGRDRELLYFCFPRRAAIRRC